MKTVFDKSTLRSILKENRRLIPAERRTQAQEKLCKELLPLLHPYRYILSFHSFGTEIDTTKLNATLAEQNKLLLPRVVGEHIVVHSVTNLQTQLTGENPKAPNPQQCQEVAIEQIDCILVPGLGFDTEKFRIGYGKGHYDRFLTAIKRLTHPARTIGMGFSEQFCEEPLPRETHDIALDDIFFL